MVRNFLFTPRQILLILLWISCIVGTYAQSDSLLAREIDTEIWHPFIQTFGAYDGEGFNKLHTTDVLRAGPWGLRKGDDYLLRNLEDNSRNKQAGHTRQIAFTFEYRVHTTDIAYEVGYYRVRSRRQGESSTSYGQFHVVLRKIDGSWKIAQDWDSSALNGIEITEAHFMKFAPNGLYE